MIGVRWLAPASAAARTTARSCSGESEIPGRIGAIRIPQGMPAATSCLTAAMRALGCGVPGSLRRHTSSSRVPMDRLAENPAVSASSTNRSRSRSSSGDLVSTEHGLA